MFGRLGVGVTASSSLADSGGGGLLLSESVCWRRGFFEVDLRSSIDWPSLGVFAPLDMSLVRGDGGIMVTFGLIESLSVSVLLLDSESDGRWVLWLGREMEMVGCLGDVGEGVRPPSLFAFGLTSLEKKFGAMGFRTCMGPAASRRERCGHHNRVPR